MPHLDVGHMRYQDHGKVSVEVEATAKAVEMT